MGVKKCASLKQYKGTAVGGFHHTIRVIAVMELCFLDRRNGWFTNGWRDYQGQPLSRSLRQWCLAVGGHMHK